MDHTYLWTYCGTEVSANPALDVSYGLEREGFDFQRCLPDYKFYNFFDLFDLDVWAI